MRCLINQLGGSDRFLHRAARRSIKSIEDRAIKDPQSNAPIIKALLTEPSGDINFDKVTKTEVVRTIVSGTKTSGWKQLIILFEQLIARPELQEERAAASRRLAIADLLSSALQNRDIEDTLIDINKDGNLVISSMLDLFARYAYYDLENAGQARPDPPISQSTRQIFRTRISSCLGHLMSKSSGAYVYGYHLIQNIRETHRSQEFGKPLLEIDGVLSQTIIKAFKVVEKVNLQAQTEITEAPIRNYMQSIILLYSLTILQMYNEDADSVTMLEELNEIFEAEVTSKSLKNGSTALVEILLSLSSRPSQLFRRLAQQVFASCASDINETGLQSIIKVRTNPIMFILG